MLPASPDLRPDRHCFRPDLTEAALEERFLPAAFVPVPAATGFGYYFSTPGFGSYLGGGGMGGSGGSGGQGAGGSGYGGGVMYSSPGAYPLVTGGINMANFGMFGNMNARNAGTTGLAGLGQMAGPPVATTGASTAGPTNNALASVGSLTALAQVYGGQSGATTRSSVTSGYSTAVSSGGNFAASYTETYNGFSAPGSLALAPTTTPSAGSSGSSNQAASPGQSVPQGPMDQTGSSQSPGVSTGSTPAVGVGPGDIASPRRLLIGPGRNR